MRYYLEHARCFLRFNESLTDVLTCARVRVCNAVTNCAKSTVTAWGAEADTDGSDTTDGRIGVGCGVMSRPVASPCTKGIWTRASDRGRGDGGNIAVNKDVAEAELKNTVDGRGGKSGCVEGRW